MNTLREQVADIIRENADRDLYLDDQSQALATIVLAIPEIAEALVRAHEAQILEQLHRR